MTSVGAFLAWTFGISSLAFLGIALVPGASSPETRLGLPFWLVAVWGPTLAVLLLAFPQGTVLQELGRLVQIAGTEPLAWMVAAFPLFILLLVALVRAPEAGDFALALKSVLPLLLFNLMLGPLGEELGWRGFLQPTLAEKFGWFQASLFVALVWFLWHTPLWLVDSPQREIPILLFGAHVLAYAVLLGAAQRASGTSVAPAVCFHLAANACAAFAVLAGYTSTVEWYRMTLVPYGAAALLVALLA